MSVCVCVSVLTGVYRRVPEGDLAGVTPAKSLSGTLLHRFPAPVDRRRKLPRKDWILINTGSNITSEHARKYEARPPQTETTSVSIQTILVLFVLA